MSKDKFDFFRKISIRTRLTLFYSLAAFILLTIISLFLYWETINILYRADHQFLANEIETVQYLFDNKSANMSDLKKEVIEIPSKINNSIYHYFIRVMDAEGNTVIETPRMEKILPAKKAFIKSAHYLNNETYWWHTEHNTHYLLIQAPIWLKTHQIGIIQIALDISYQHAIINDRNFFIIAIILSAICALFLGFFISNRAMRSLYVLTKTAKEISVTSLNQRIEPKYWPNELRALGIAFNQMLDRIESSFIRLKQFSSDLAHELRTPVSNLIGQTEIALSHTQSIDDYKQLLESNLEELHRVSQLTENILFLSRAENPQMEIHKSLLALYNEVVSVSDYYQTIADEKNIHLTCEGNASLLANGIMIRRVISNLLSNALKYTPPEGYVHIQIQETPHQTVEIQIRDTGIGIPAEHLAKIFDRFYRVDAARSQCAGGAGLGLAIVKSIVDLHHGAITVTSNVDVGTTFLLTFPK
ncbi:MAG: heavy metal sensor histidine kinase [Gammaproteobacteria bacterium]|nr:heavy metal sensor histidine kinase [Gammaproteobacteria bacterium]